MLIKYISNIYIIFLIKITTSSMNDSIHDRYNHIDYIELTYEVFTIEKIR